MVGRVAVIFAGLVSIQPRRIMTSLSDVPSGASSRNVERPVFPKAGEGNLEHGRAGD